MRGTLVARWRLGRDFDLCVCVPLQAAHKVFAGKEVKFFSEGWKTMRTLLLFCALLSLFLSLSAFFLISALLSDDERGRIIARDDSRVLLLLLLRVFFFSSFPSTLGKFYSRRHHGGVCVGCVLLSSSRIFFLLFLSSSFRAELCALFCMHVLFLSRISSFPLYLSNA